MCLRSAPIRAAVTGLCRGVVSRPRLLSGWAAGSEGAAGLTGLFSVPRLQQPSDFLRWAEDAQARCSELVDAALAAPADASVVRLIDDISDQVSIISWVSAQ